MDEEEIQLPELTNQSSNQLSLFDVFNISKELEPVNKSEITEVDNTINEQIEEDFNKVRTNLNNIIDQTQKLLNAAVVVSDEGFDHKVVDSTSTLLKTMITANKALLEIHKQKAELDKTTAYEEEKKVEAETITNIQNNVVFAGTTKELRDFLKNEIMK